MWNPSWPAWGSKSSRAAGPHGARLNTSSQGWINSEWINTNLSPTQRDGPREVELCFFSPPVPIGSNRTDIFIIFLRPFLHPLWVLFIYSRKTGIGLLETSTALSLIFQCKSPWTKSCRISSYQQMNNIMTQCPHRKPAGSDVGLSPRNI